MIFRWMAGARLSREWGRMAMRRGHALGSKPYRVFQRVGGMGWGLGNRFCSDGRKGRKQRPTTFSHLFFLSRKNHKLPSLQQTSFHSSRSTSNHQPQEIKPSRNPISNSSTYIHIHSSPHSSRPSSRTLILTVHSAKG